MARAAQDGDLVRLRELLDEDPALARAKTPEGMTVLHLVLYMRRPEVTRILLDRGALRTVYEAAILGDVDALARFLAKRPQALDAPGPDGFPPLHLAAHFGQHDAVGWLLDKGADLHAFGTNDTVNTALHAAAAAGVVSTAKVLLSSGADTEARDAGGNTPLHIAAANGAAPVVQALLDAGADVTARNGTGETPVDVARQRDKGEVVALLAADAEA